jgi:hypothetical protein
MANKQLDQLTELTEAKADDLIPIYDSEESGSEKLKKYDIQSLKTDLTSMDPSAFGNWVKIGEQSGTLDRLKTIDFVSDISNYEKIMFQVSVESVAAETMFLFSVGDSSWDDNNSNYNSTAGLTYGRSIIESFDGSMEFTLVWTPRTKIVRVIGTSYESNTSNIDFSIKYTGSNTCTGLLVESWLNTHINFTGKAACYGWQEVKPIELHSYELVKEYNLDNEALLDTFDWDGEADTECRIVSDYKSTGATVLRVRCNEDSANNYPTAMLYNNGSAAAGYYTTINGFELGYCYAGGSCSSDVTLYLKNMGERRKSIGRQNRHDPAAGTTMLALAGGSHWTNTADDVESLTLTSQGANITGKIRVYKLAKTHLFNQTIYNDTTLNVATTGSDTTGTGSSQKPFASINGAVDWLKNKTLNDDVTVTIQLADGTYNNLENVIIRNKRVTIEGNTTTPSNVTLNFASDQNGISALDYSDVTLKGVKIHGLTTSGYRSGLIAGNRSALYVSDTLIDNFNRGVTCNHSSNVHITGSGVTIDSCEYGVMSVWNGFIGLSGINLTNHSTGAYADTMARVLVNSSTLSGNTQNSVTYTAGTVTIV